MNAISVLSWNVNGIRSVYEKGFLSWLKHAEPTIICLQETRAKSSQLNSDLVCPAGYHAYWNSATRPGYSGTALLSRKKPLCIEFGLGEIEFDQEGRTIIAEYSDFTLINCYFPNGNRDYGRLAFKIGFFEAFFAKCERLRAQGHTLLFGGDLNTAHDDIDLAHPKSNRNRSGFLRKERKLIDKFIEAGYIDTFRHFYPRLAKQYTWWSHTAGSREHNCGWRFDYIFAAREILARVREAFIMSDVKYSDHAPVGISIETKVYD